MLLILRQSVPLNNHWARTLRVRSFYFTGSNRSLKSFFRYVLNLRGGIKFLIISHNKTVIMLECMHIIQD